MDLGLNRLQSRFILKEKAFLIDYPIYAIELVFVELPKFAKVVDDLETLADKWLYFLKSAKQLQVVPERMNVVPEIKKAFEIANQANLSQDELDDLEHREMFIHDQRNTIEKALRQGLKQGLEQGKEEGRLETKLEIAKQLIDMLDNEAIARTTGLSVDEVAQLRNS